MRARRRCSAAARAGQRRGARAGRARLCGRTARSTVAPRHPRRAKPLPPPRVALRIARLPLCFFARASLFFFFLVVTRREACTAAAALFLRGLEKGPARAVSGEYSLQFVLRGCRVWGVIWSAHVFCGEIYPNDGEFRRE